MIIDTDYGTVIVDPELKVSFTDELERINSALRLGDRFIPPYGTAVRFFGEVIVRNDQGCIAVTEVMYLMRAEFGATGEVALYFCHDYAVVHKDWLAVYAHETSYEIVSLPEDCAPFSTWERF